MSRSPRKQQIKGVEPKTRGKGETKTKEKQPFMEDGPFSDVIITVGDKKFYSNSGVLAYNSPILMSTLTEDKSNETETKGQKGQQKGQKKGQTPCKNNKELDWSNMHYRDVYEMLSFIDPRVDADLTDETAMRLLPLSEEFDMKLLRKACLSTLYDSFISLQKGRRPGYIHIEITMQYLKLADQYERDHAGQKPDTSRSGMSLNSRKSDQGKKSLKALCVNELLANTDPFVGKLVADTDGLSKELKRFILEKKLNQVNMVLARERQARIDVSPLRKSILFRK